MPMEELFRIVRPVTVAQMLERDDFAKRMAAVEPVSLLEILYPVLQGYDLVAVRRMSSSGAPTRPSTCTWAARCSPATASHPRSC